ncbi:DUF397 domain-containing protein [Actinoplanes sp. TBRC 11911]|uniref:DUF397 domain-containing protein n=1 Tax=Actinoplanes sp. TBRC 11911 TaxID=2729386 RepID=UPI00145F98C3|nr:DUF397 domain-containing protein [Actinoplanes sp. TBRC 11911]NMO51264.1 DUF397 domain-containing protein [Actinoplanes sp. TBRC 11911]
MDTLDDNWRKSTRSAQGDCVEVSYRSHDETILVRDTKAAGKGPVLAFTRSEWTAFLGGIHDGEFNLPAQ